MVYYGVSNSRLRAVDIEYYMSAAGYHLLSWLVCATLYCSLNNNPNVFTPEFFYRGEK